MSDEKTPLTEEHKQNLPDLAEVVGLLERINQKNEKDVFDREQMDKLTGKIGELATAFSRASQQKKHEWAVDDAEDERRDGRSSNKGIAAIEDLQNEITDDPDVLRAQTALDRSYMLSKLLHKPVTKLKYFQNAMKSIPYFKKSLDVADVTQTLTATGWQPAVFTQRMIEKVRLELVISQLHPRIDMPADPYRFPIEGGDATAYLVNERAGADDDLTAGNRVTAGLSSTGATNMVMSSQKVGTRIVTSTEVTEDSFIPILEYLENKIALSMAYLQDNVTVNGDKTAATLDTGGGGYGAMDQRKAWDGYRKYLQGKTSKVANTASAGASFVDIADIRKVRQNMGKYGIKPRDLVMVVGPVGYIKLLACKDGSNPTPVLTLEKYGPQATIRTGEIGSLDGIPIIVTEHLGPSNVSSGVESFNAQGTFDGVTTTYTEILFVRPSAFLYGDRRAAQLKTEELIQTDQQLMVTMQRLTFNNLYSSDNVVGGITGILK